LAKNEARRLAAAEELVTDYFYTFNGALVNPPPTGLTTRVLTPTHPWGLWSTSMVLHPFFVISAQIIPFSSSSSCDVSALALTLVVSLG
jgi:hypothetical protein